MISFLAATDRRFHGFGQASAMEATKLANSFFDLRLLVQNDIQQ